eukprot:915971-Pyramimonas_sp.AAC.2
MTDGADYMGGAPCIPDEDMDLGRSGGSGGRAGAHLVEAGSVKERRVVHAANVVASPVLLLQRQDGALVLQLAPAPRPSKKSTADSP